KRGFGETPTGPHRSSAHFTGSIGVGTSIPLLLTTISMVSVFQRSVVRGSSLRRTSGPPGAVLRFLLLAKMNSCVTPRSFHFCQMGSLRLTLCVAACSLLKVSVRVYSFAPALNGSLPLKNESTLYS